MVSKLPPGIRRELKSLTIFYLIFLLVILLLLKHVGERNWISSVLIYLPPTGWLLPLAFLTPLCLFCRSRLYWLHLLAVLFVFFFYMDFHWSFRTTPKKSTLTLVTNNVGDRKSQTLQTFLKSETPDIIALQDAGLRARPISKENPDRFVAQQGQFLLVSKYEIKNSGYVPGLLSSIGPAAAWFELDYQGKTIVIYNVHFPTPRPDFYKLRGRGFLAELRSLGGIYSSEVRDEYRKSMANRVQLARNFLAWLEKEQRPFLVVGDFNMPSQGYLYDLFSDRFTDSFATKGRGYGLTFPGTTRNPLSLFGPWLRIDYIFTSKDWGPVRSRIESTQDAEHLALLGEFELKDAH